MAMRTGQPPTDLDIEGELLGALLSGELSLAELEGLEARYFWSMSNRTIFETISSLEATGIPWNSLSVASALRSSGKLRGCGGVAYLLQTLPLCQPAVSVEVARVHVQELRRLWTWRETRLALRWAAEAINELPPAEVLDELRKRLKECSNGVGSKSQKCAEPRPGSCSSSTAEPAQRGSARPATGGSSRTPGPAREGAAKSPRAAPRPPPDAPRRAGR
jgi:replicative DNA helicase